MIDEDEGEARSENWVAEALSSTSTSHLSERSFSDNAKSKYLFFPACKSISIVLRGATHCFMIQQLHGDKMLLDLGEALGAVLGSQSREITKPAS